MTARAVLLDVGCVLIHPHEQHFRQAVADALRRDLLAGTALPALARTVWTGAAVVDPAAFWTGDGKARAWAAHAGLPEGDGPAVWQALERLDTDASPLWSCVDGDAPATLARLRADGYLIAAVSNGDGTLDRDLNAAQLTGYFDAVLDSSVEGVHKPDPRIYERAADRLGVSVRQCVFVGDDPLFDIDGSIRAGVGKAILLDAYRLRPADWLGPAAGSLAELPAQIGR